MTEFEVWTPGDLKDWKPSKEWLARRELAKRLTIQSARSQYPMGAAGPLVQIA